jgi:hypothetical protein
MHDHALGDRGRTSVRLAARVLGVCVCAAWTWGAVRFLMADASVTFVLPKLDDPPSAEHNLASFRLGPRLRASSYHRAASPHHQPAFLIDGNQSPTLVDKWTSAVRDREPWVEVAWPEIHAVSQVRIHHAGRYESPAFTVRNYRIACLPEQDGNGSLTIRDNRAAIAIHALRCDRAQALRIDWMLEGNNDVARIYELEIWGR